MGANPKWSNLETVQEIYEQIVDDVPNSDLIIWFTETIRHST